MLSSIALSALPKGSSSFFSSSSLLSSARCLATVVQSGSISNATNQKRGVHLELKSGEVFKAKSFGAEIPISGKKTPTAKTSTTTRLTSFTSFYFLLLLLLCLLCLLLGELVFTTSLVGYPESMTDPSYRGQIIVFTQPLIGNYGVPGTARDQFGLLKHFESERIQVSGIVVSNYSAKYSHWAAVESLGEWCIRQGVPAFSDVDTRALTKLLRDKGSGLGRMVFGENAGAFIDPNAVVRNLPIPLTLLVI